MNKGLVLALLVAALGGGAWSAHAAEPVSAPTPDSGLAHVQAQKAAAYAAVLAEFDRAMQAAPDDPSIGVARCEYIDRFTDDEVGEWIDSAPDDLEKCRTAIEARWPESPVVQLFRLERSWDVEAIALGDQLGKAIDAWPAPLRRRAYAHLAFVYEHSDDKRSGELAVKAARAGDGDSVADAIDHLVAQKRFDEATRLLQSAPLATSDWVATGVIQSALALPDPQAAVRALRRYDGTEVKPSDFVAARALLRAGDVVAARKRLPKDEASSRRDIDAAFEVAIANRDATAALKYIAFEDFDDIGMSLQRSAVLAKTMPSSLASPTMLAMAFVLVAFLGAITLFAGALLLPAHYRGLARRVRGVRTVPVFERITLWHAWYAAAVAICVPVLAVAVVAPETLAAVLGDDKSKPTLMFQAMLWSTLAGLVCFAPAIRGIPWRQLVGDRAVWRDWKRVPLAWAALWAVGIALTFYHQWTGGGGGTAHTKLIESIAEGGLAALGGFGTVVLIAVLVPIFEELTFRGLLLGGLTRHISFGWANAAQALVFATIHGDPPRFLFYFAMGLLAGWLVKTTKSLGPAIVLHALNNAVAVGFLMAQ